MQSSSLATRSVEGFWTLERRFPALRKAIWRSFYDFMAWRFALPEWTFMNYGYTDLDHGAPALELSAQDEEHRSSIQLYAHTLGGVDLTGLDVLEVGSGRGGGASWIARSQGVRSMTGLDLAGRAVRFCRRRHKVDNLEFRRAEAGNLPFPDESLGAVVNVESCHHYPSMGSFIDEVHRVLRPGGHFLLTDYRDAPDVQDLRQQILDSPFEIVRECDISANVLAALDRDDERKQAMINTHVPRLLRHYVRSFAGTSGSEIHDRFADGRLQYLSYVLRKQP